MKTTATETHVTADGSSTDVRRWVFSMGLSLGAEQYFQESCDSAGAYLDTTRVTGWELVAVDGGVAGMMLKTQDGLCAVVRNSFVEQA